MRAYHCLDEIATFYSFFYINKNPKLKQFQFE